MMLVNFYLCVIVILEIPKMSSFLNGLEIKFLFCCFFMQTFPGPKCLKISLIAKLSVCL